MIEPTSAGPSIPTHIAIIMDGNGRWAKSRGLPRSAGHKKGADALKRVMESCRSAKVAFLTIYAFSSENWKRPADEISDLMHLLGYYLEHELPELHRNQIRLRFIGDLSRIEDKLRTRIQKAMDMTAGNSGFNLTVALSYGARQEIARAVQALAAQAKEGTLEIAAIDEELISKTLDTSDLPEPDLLIRTGGEQRLSNFLLWQSAYTELYFTDILWPDFGDAHFSQALGDYAKRERRYGNTGQ
ncbi:MAG: isoprenyl transferase [Rickettsiales bacterium]|nr:isoprenyl transferase [Rickettsiales bacterium]